MSQANPTDAILQALALYEERTQGELLDISGLRSHIELESCLLPLIMSNQISVHFGVGKRVYRLIEQEPSTIPYSWMAPKPPE